MKMIITNEFLCFELEMGGRILAWFRIIVNGILALIFMQGFRYVDTIAYLIAILRNRLDSDEYIWRYEKYIPAVIIALAVYFVLYTGTVIVSILLNIGIKTRNQNFILPSVIVSVIETAIVATFGLYTAIVAKESMAFILLSLITSSYVTVVLISLYGKIKDAKRITPTTDVEGNFELRKL